MRRGGFRVVSDRETGEGLTVRLYINFSEWGTYLRHYRRADGELRFVLRLESGCLYDKPSWHIFGRTQEQIDFILACSK